MNILQGDVTLQQSGDQYNLQYFVHIDCVNDRNCNDLWKNLDIQPHRFWTVYDKHLCQPLAVWNHSASFRYVSGKFAACHSKTSCLQHRTFSARSCIGRKTFHQIRWLWIIFGEYSLHSANNIPNLENYPSNSGIFTK